MLHGQEVAGDGHIFHQWCQIADDVAYANVFVEIWLQGYTMYGLGVNIQVCIRYIYAEV